MEPPPIVILQDHIKENTNVLEKTNELETTNMLQDHIESNHIKEKTNVLVEKESRLLGRDRGQMLCRR